MDSDITKKIFLSLIAVTIVVIALAKIGCIGSLSKRQETSSESISTSETAADTESLADEVSETSHRLMYSSIIGSMFR